MADGIGAAVTLTRTEHTAPRRRALAANRQDTAPTRRLVAIAMVLEGPARRAAARQTGIDRQTGRDWASLAKLPTPPPLAAQRWAIAMTKRRSPT